MKKRPVIQFALDGNQIANHSSALAAAQELNLSQSSITRCAQGHRHTVGGFIFLFRDRDPEETDITTDLATRISILPKVADSTRAISNIIIYARPEQKLYLEEKSLKEIKRSAGVSLKNLQDTIETFPHYNHVLGFYAGYKHCFSAIELAKIKQQCDDYKAPEPEGKKLSRLEQLDAELDNFDPSDT